MPKPSTRWIEDLPRDRFIAEFSTWSADLVRLAEDLRRIEPFADVLHVDVADGHFAPAMLFFPDLVARIRAVSPVPIHVHLMVTDDILIDQVRQFAAAGADLVSIHCENETVADDALALIEELGIAAGMVLQLHTPVSTVARYLDRLRFVTLLGTAIGVMGKGLDDTAYDRIVEAKALIASSLVASAGPGRRILLAADGGNREHTVPLLRQAGAETVVLGSLAFGAQDLAARMSWLRSL